jgi:plastocyanin
VTLSTGSQMHRSCDLLRLRDPLLVALVLGWGALCSTPDAFPADPAGKPAMHTVDIDGVAFQPAVLVVKRGDTVVWVNKDPFPHTVTAQGAFDSHDIPAGASWKYVARKPGTYAYICTLHSNMKGTLTVQ